MEGERKAGAAKVFCVVSVIAGLVAIALCLAHLASRSDIGTDLGIDNPTAKALFRLAALPVIGIGLAAALAAVATSPNMKSRLGAPLPGLIVNGFALLWWIWPR